MIIIPLGNNIRAEVIDSVIGQLSDGIWENSGAMNKYWMFAHTKGTNLEISEDYSKRYGSSRTIWNGFNGKSEKEIKDWFANKAKQVVKIWAEDYHKDLKAVWDRNNTEEVDYMGGHNVPNITVADVYECYDFLKGRSGKKYATAPIEEPAEEVIDAPYEVLDEVVEPKVSGGMNPSQQEVEDFFLDASTRTRGRSIKASRRTFTKYPSSYVKASIDNGEILQGACYIDNYNKWVRGNYSGVLENIMGMANRCLQGSGLSVPNIDSIGVADNGQLLGFYNLYKTQSGNSYSIGWQGGEWKLSIYDNLPADNLHWLADAMDEINNTFNGIKFHEDRPII